MRRQRTPVESVASIVLAFEVVVIGLGALAAWALGSVAMAPAFIAGASLVVLAAITVLTLRYPFGVWLGWAVQALVIVSGIWVHMMFAVGIVFIALWAYAVISAERAMRMRAEQESQFNDHVSGTEHHQ
ncbi:DUF4233 domain-containing protein [Gryllotalpicola sp.]|uniref:DUF4233 domain-containing protein n=1 Tax=Gryllotalpicola sp. TaxID=1932787 RepID=UPI002630DC9B|nr:DUF4233 domain-containing protein [Gryllotalpicola sp.]